MLNRKGILLKMDLNFFTPEEVMEVNLRSGDGKTKHPVLKLVLLGILAGAFVSFGAVASGIAMQGIANFGMSRLVAGCIFPVGLMMITFVGGELFTSSCMMIAGVLDKRFGVFTMVRTLVYLYLSNLIGAAVVAVLVYFSGVLNYSGGAIGAHAINVAYGKASIAPVAGICSGILCNILVCIATLKATAAKDIAGKVWAIFFPIMLFVLCGFEHCVANMYYLIVGMLASMNDKYVAVCEQLYGLNAADIGSTINIGGFFANQIPVTIGNILGGMVFVAIPLYVIHKSKLCNN